MISFSENWTKQKVWEKARIVYGCDPGQWRKDECGAWMNWNHYGRRDSTFGWEFHHMIPKSHGGTDDVYNLIPLQWENNAERSDGPPMCPVRSQGDRNYRFW